MSENALKEMKATRRGFIKGAVSAAGATAGLGLFSTATWLKPQEASAEPEEKRVCTYHQGHCGGRCPIQCTVRDGRLVLIEPNPHVTEDRYKTMCLKGVSELEHIYGEHRIQSPLKRVGERCSGQFEAISWDQAYQEIADKIREIQAANGKGSIAYYGGGECHEPQILKDVLELGTFINEGAVDIGIANGLERAYGFGDTVAYATQESRDWVNSKTVLVMGTNYLETSLTTVRNWFDAQDAGAKFIVVDPNFSTSAGKADQWIPIEPATDAAFVLGMISYIIDEKLYDEDFVRNKTSLPFLVNKKTGIILRDHEAGYYDYWMPEENTAEGNPFYVIKDGKAVVFDTVADPELSGTVTIDGEEYCTAWDILLETQQPYTLDWAAEITHVPTETIAQVARDYAEGPSSFVVGWGGNEKFANADIAGHATALVTALTGNIGKPGAGVGCYTCGMWNGYIVYLGAWDSGYVPTEEPVYVDVTTVRTDPESPIRGIVGQGDFTQKFANLALTEEWVRSLDLAVSIDVYYSEATRLSDYVLPITSRFEYDEPTGVATSGYNAIILQQKVLDPLFEAKTFMTLQRELAEACGIDQVKYFPQSNEEYNNASFAAYTYDPWIRGLTHQDLVDANAWLHNPSTDEPRLEFADQVFTTASGRMDVYYDDLADIEQAFPTWVPAIEAYEGNPLRDQYPLTFYNGHSRYRIHNQFHNAKWLDEVFTTRIELAPEDMEARGIESGEKVEVFNNRGSLVVTAFANPAVRQGTTRMIEGCASRYLEGEGKGGYNSVTNDQVDPRGYRLYSGPQTPFSDTLVEVRKA